MQRFTIWLLGLLLLGCGGGDAEAAKLVKGSRSVAGDSIQLSASVTRTSCIAPCFVFFDATATTSSLTTLPFHEIEYRWTFDDPGSGTWSTGAQPGVLSKNAATGPIAGHLYETAGTFTPGATARYGAVTASTSLPTITVTSADDAPQFDSPATVCVSTDSDFTGCPADVLAAERRTTGDWATAIGYLGTTVKRLLFKRGQTWEALATVNKVTAGPVLIGAFGSGNKPVWQLAASYSTATTYLLRLGNSIANSANDWRIMDIEVDGSLVPYPHRHAAFYSNGTHDQLTLLNIDTRHMNLRVEFGETILAIHTRTQPNQHIWDQLAIVGGVNLTPANTSNTHDFFACERCFYAGVDNDVAGIFADGTGTKSHNARLTYGYKVVFSNSTMANPGGEPARHMFKIHGPTWVESSVGADDWQPAMLETNNAFVHPDNASGGAVLMATTTGGGAGKTKYIVLSDNKTISTLPTNTAGWHFSIGPPDNVNYSLVEDVIVERNLSVGGASFAAAIETQSTRLTARNNIWDARVNGIDRTGVYSYIRHLDVPAGDTWVYHNTGYHDDGPKNEPWIRIETGITNSIVRNNLAYGVGDTTSVLLTNNGTGTLSGTNTGDIGSIPTDPLFVDTAFNLITDWKLQAGSYAIDAGAVVPVWSDFFWVLRTPGLPDLGATERP